MVLKITDFKWINPIIYFFVGVYSWIDDKGINAYILMLLFFFMFLDIGLGWVKSIVVKGLPNPSSEKAKKGILTKVILFVIPVISGLIWSVFDKENALKIVNLQLGALMVAEGYSNIANAYTIYSGEVLTEFDAVTFVFKKVAAKIKMLLETILDSRNES